MSELSASVVIGFKDWGLDRLQRCIRSIQMSFDDLPIEVITSDYGSADGPAVREATEAAGGVYVRTESGESWSRSRAINAGLATARGELFLATDADMIFTPGALAQVAERVRSNPGEAIILQCRDLPPGVTIPTGSDPDWAEFARVATIRPRWGMGGLVATSKDVYLRLRGYDERMHTYGGEDIDYGKRMRRWGIPINWYDEPGVRMYHVWHPSTSAAAARSPEATAAIAHNREIHTSDLTTVRNIQDYRGRRPDTPPLVSVVVPVDSQRDTRLVEELNSLLGQTVTELEVLLVGEDDGPAQLLRSLDDPRLRVARIQNDQWWRAASDVRGTFVLFHAPGALHASGRIENLLSRTSLSGTVARDGLVALLRQEDETLVELPAQSVPSMPYPWASMLIPSALAQRALDSIPRFATDPHEIVFAVLRNGADLVHVDGIGRVQIIDDTATGEIALDVALRGAKSLRARLEAAGQRAGWITVMDAKNGVATRMAATLLTGRQDIVVITSDSEVSGWLVEFFASDPEVQARRNTVSEGPGLDLFEMFVASGVRTTDARRIQSLAKGRRGTTTTLSTLADSDVSPSDVDLLLDELARLYSDDTSPASWLVVEGDGDAMVQSFLALERLAGVSTVLRRTLTDGASTRHLVVASLESISGALEVLVKARRQLAPASTVELRLRRTVSSLESMERKRIS